MSLRRAARAVALALVMVAATAGTPARAGTTPARISPTCGRPGARVVGVRFSVERGLGVTRAQFARAVMRVLCDDRGWIASGRVRFKESARGRLLISLRWERSTRARCYRFLRFDVGIFSCASRREVVLNADRWRRGSRYWRGPVGEYRRLLVNHEVGHALGQRHRGCAGRGRRAPAMMQQSKGLRGCARNPWPLGYELRSLRP